MSTIVVLPRGACSRRRAVPDWTSLGPWSREGRSRFTSASPASLHRRRFRCPSLSVRSCAGPSPSHLGPSCAAAEHAAALPVSPSLPSATTSRDISEREGDGKRGREAFNAGEQKEKERRMKKERGTMEKEAPLFTLSRSSAVYVRIATPLL